MMRHLKIMILVSVIVLLYGCQVEQTITIQFDTNGGSPISDLFFDMDDDIILPDSPVKEGYAFIGWYLDASLTSAYEEDALIHITTGDEIMLYAKWEIITYHISYELSGGIQHPSQQITYTVEDEITLLEPTRSGYQFDGWYLDDTFMMVIDKIELGSTGDLILYAKWEQVQLITYTITFKDYDGTILEIDQVIKGAFPIYNGNTPQRPDTDTHTYLFSGWAPALSAATEDQEYTATYTERLINESGLFDPVELNQIFGFDIYQMIPEIKEADYLVLDYSTDTFYEVYIDIFSWTDQESDDYINQLDLELSWSELEESWILGDYFIYVYADTGSYPGKTVYGIAIYGLVLEDVIYETWDEMMLVLEVNLNEPSLDVLIPSLDDLSDIKIIPIKGDEYQIQGKIDGALIESSLEQFRNDVLAKGFIYQPELSLVRGFDVYSYHVNDDLSYGMMWSFDQSLVTLSIWSYDPIIDSSHMTTLSKRQSINEYEELTFGKSGLPSVGTFDVLVIPIEISGTPFPLDYLGKLDLVFNGTRLSTGWESVASFYQKSSYGLLNLSFDITSKFVTSHPKSYYENLGVDSEQYAIVEALQGLNPTIDYSQYDENDDGLIDAVIFIYSVDYNYDVEPWWAWVYAAQYGQGSTITTLDGKGFEYFMWASYQFLEDGLPNVSNLVVNAETYIHELGHLMGAVDLYSYTHDYGPIGGMGMMDMNNGDHEPLHKMLFGWLTPLVATEGTYQVDLESYSIDQDGVGSAIVVPYQSDNFDDGNAFDEFIIIIFYTPEGLYDAHQGLNYVLDQAAVIVYHVDARIFNNTSFWDGYFMYNNDGPSDFTSEILEVDKNNSLPSMFGPIEMNDVLTSGIFDLNSYQWHQGGSIDISIQVITTISNTSDAVTLVINVN